MERFITIDAFNSFLLRVVRSVECCKNKTLLQCKNFYIKSFSPYPLTPLTVDAVAGGGDPCLSRATKYALRMSALSSGNESSSRCLLSICNAFKIAFMATIFPCPLSSLMIPHDLCVIVLVSAKSSLNSSTLRSFRSMMYDSNACFLTSSSSENFMKTSS